MFIEDFNKTINYWINQLQQYDFAELCSKPSVNSWSLGQLFLHLISDTDFYIMQANLALSARDNSGKSATANGREMLDNNSFPDEIIVGAPSNNLIQQPGSKEELISGMERIKREINELAGHLETLDGPAGKSMHPGLGYFSTAEWLQFADMHFRHHLRQKKRIDDFLSANKNHQ